MRREHLDGVAPSRFTQKRNSLPQLEEWHFSQGGETPSAGQPQPLLRLPALNHARLTVAAVVNTRGDALHQFTAMVEGLRPDGSPFAIAVHLDDDRRKDCADRMGSGACGHAAFHC